MAMTRMNGGDALSLDGLPADDAVTGSRPSADTRLSRLLRALWGEYVSDNRREWNRLVDEQAQNPTLD